MLALAAVISALAISNGVAAHYWDWPKREHCTTTTTVQLVTSDVLNDDRDRTSGQKAAVAVAADSNPATCTIRIAWDTVDTRADACALLVHEQGHLHELAFPENPADPVHSPDPEDVMFSDPAPPVDCMRAFTPYRVRALRRAGRYCTATPTAYAWICGRRGHRDIWVNVI